MILSALRARSQAQHVPERSIEGQHTMDQMISWEELMHQAVVLGEGVRQTTPPNPWVGAIVVPADGSTPVSGATEPPGSRHAERVALDAAGSRAHGGTLVVTLEPCSHQGRTAPCADAIIDAGITRVVVGVEDPDTHVAGAGIARLRSAGVEVIMGVAASEVEVSLRAYLHHRRTGRPFVVLKLAMTLDGRTAAHDGTSKWITGEEARADVQRLRASSDAILVGAGTVRSDDPELTARTDPPPQRQPLRVVLGTAPEGARVRPALELTGDLGEVIDHLGRLGVLQLLVEGGATVAHDFVSAGFIDLFVVYVAPAIMGGDDGVPVLKGPGAASLEGMWRGDFISVTKLGDDLRLEVMA